MNMKYTSALNWLVMTVLMLGGLMGSPVITDRSFDDIIVGSGAGGGPHIKVFNGSTDRVDVERVDVESEQADDLRDDQGSSDDNEQSSNQSDPEWRYVPVRRTAHL
jgi:hypothetical protein